ncbi:FUSC family protein [Streptomyces djakartensis]|uniref:FUSC family protein n=1 Tax=Streptomyces djakartensis TaxID=68193 RepID=UPI0034DEFD86
MPKRPSLSESVRAGRRALRVTVAAAVGFYPALHLWDRPVTAVYALFAPIAFGVLSPNPGSGRRRAGTVLRVMPAAAALVALGTVLAVSTWSAVAGMLFVGFVLTFGTTFGPRPAGTAPGLQLFYILACFPPYAPDTLPQRLAGLAVGMVLLSLGELLLLPDPPESSYRERVADALAFAAHAAGRLAGGATEPVGAARLRQAGRELRLSRQPPGTRPTGPGRTDRALAHAGSATRRLLDQLATLTGLPATGADLASDALLRGVAACCQETAGALRRVRPAAGPELIEEMIAHFLAVRGAPPDVRTPSALALLRRRSTVLTIAVSAVTARTAVALAIDDRTPVHGLPREQFWYARTDPVRLWLIRATGHLTRRSVVFQNAWRVALGLALARLVAGSLDLPHGFWVLLSVLTLGRTTAVATWSVVRPAAVGTLVGAFAAGLLVVGAGGSAAVYEYLLVPMMLVAFTVGPVEGPAWAQGLFTLVVATAFAQLAPVTWRLAEARLVDVLTGSAIGLLCGLLAWPAGARAEVRHSVGVLLRATAPLVGATARAATRGPGPTAAEGQGAGPTAGPGSGGATAGPDPRSARELADQALRLTRHRLRIAEGAYAQYRTEPSPRTEADGPDWLAALNYGARVLVGAFWLPRTGEGGRLPQAARDWVTRACGEVEAATRQVADFPAHPVRVRLTPLPPEVAAAVPPRLLPPLIDVEVWLSALAADLRAATGHHGSGAGVRGRAAVGPAGRRRSHRDRVGLRGR